MKLAIISDSHDNIPRIDQMFDIIKKENIESIIHCGDVATLESLKYLSKKFSKTIYLSLGNVDETHGLQKKYINLENIVVFEKFGELSFDKINIAFTHFPKLAKELAQSQKYDFVFYGHTHKPWEEYISSTKLINPGTLAGMFNRSTFAILDTKTKNIELKIL